MKKFPAELTELLKSIKVERVVLNALALDTDLLPDSCDEYRRYRKWNCAFGDFLTSPSGEVDPP
jgi:hypothetical protein